MVRYKLNEKTLKNVLAYSVVIFCLLCIIL